MDAEVSHQLKYGPAQAHTQIDGGFLGNTICVVTSEDLQHFFFFSFFFFNASKAQILNHRTTDTQVEK